MLARTDLFDLLDEFTEDCVDLFSIDTRPVIFDFQTDYFVVFVKFNFNLATLFAGVSGKIPL